MAGKRSRSLNPSGSRAKRVEGDDFNNQDVKRRIGNFTTAGEHARVGGRSTGIVGQKRQRFTTEKRSRGSR